MEIKNFTLGCLAILAILAITFIMAGMSPLGLFFLEGILLPIACGWALGVIAMLWEEREERV